MRSCMRSKWGKRRRQQLRQPRETEKTCSEPRARRDALDAGPAGAGLGVRRRATAAARTRRNQGVFYGSRGAVYGPPLLFAGCDTGHGAT